VKSDPSAARPLPTFHGEVEMRPSFALRPDVTHVVFDFDGTLSWVRHGWPALMFEVFRRHLAASGVPAAIAEAELDAIVFGMNGQPTVVQMARFAALLRERCGVERNADALRTEFQDELDTRIAARLAAIRSGAAEADTLVIHGARALLEWLRAQGLTLTIVSSTIEHRVREEAEALGLAEFFGSRIYGSGSDPRAFSKKAVFERLLGGAGINGRQLLSFGDGPIEIATTKELGGLAVAVCSDEEQNGSGNLDPHKRRLLLDAGADAAIPDYRDARALVAHLLGR
jgi:phosphoglycolate phosphatase